MPPLRCDLAVEWPDGKAIAYVAARLGEPSRLIGWKEARAKFLGLATPVFGKARSIEIASGVASVDASDARSLNSQFRI